VRVHGGGKITKINLAFLFMRYPLVTRAFWMYEV
jgi:hypothetical protein